jgi:hypothetical protein
MSASTAGSCSPTSRKASPLTTKISIFHTDVPSSRAPERMIRGAR